MGWPSSLGKLRSEQWGLGEASNLPIAGNSQKAFPVLRDVGARAAPSPELGAEASTGGPPHLELLMAPLSLRPRQLREQDL